MADSKLFEISPLGAAIVEAMPSAKRKAKVQRLFQSGRCPSSALFAAREVTAFYRRRGQAVKGIDLGESDVRLP